jgi:hypothetical protein
MLQRIDFGRLVRALLQRGYTTASLGQAIGLTQPSVSRLATNVTKDVSAQVGVELIRLAGGTVILPAEAAEQTDEAQAAV